MIFSIATSFDNFLMSQSNLTPKFFRPSHRTVSCHNGLLNTKTKNIRAEDRFVVAERQKLDIEHRRSTGYLQNLSHEQKLLERRNSTSKVRSQSTGEISSLARSSSWNEGIARVNSNNLLKPKINDFCRRFSDGGEAMEIHPPSVAVIPPDDEFESEEKTLFFLN